MKVSEMIEALKKFERISKSTRVAYMEGSRLFYIDIVSYEIEPGMEDTIILSRGRPSDEQ